MGRPLLALSAAFGAGCLTADAGGGWQEAWVLAFLAAVLLVAALLVGVRSAALALVGATVALGALAAQIESRRFVEGPLRTRLVSEIEEGEPLLLIGEARGDGRPVGGRLQVTLDVQELRLRGRPALAPGRVIVGIGGEAEWPTVVDGDRVSLWATLRLLKPGEGARRGLVARGYCKSGRLVEVREGDDVGLVRRVTARARRALRRQLTEALFPGPERGLVLAMVLGDRSELDDATADAFKASGTYHVLALSGAQVALVAALIVGALRWARAGPALEAVVTSGCVWFYALLVGADVPIVRAAFMASVVLAGRAFDLAGDAANLLGFTALALLVWNPGYAWDVGFQLSFGATLGILVLTSPLGHGVPRLPLRADLAVIASVAAQVVLSPLLAVHFHRLAPAALALNLLAVPLSAAVLLAGLATLALTPLPWAAAWSADVAWISAHALRLSGDLGPLAPWLDVRVAAPTALAVAVHVTGLVVLARGRRGSGLGLLLASHVGLLVGPPPLTGDGRLHMTALDVGQGDSLLLRSPTGRALLVDAGGSWNPRYDVGEQRVAPALWRRGVRRLDTLVLTHAHADHVGGASFLLDTFPVDQVWEGPAVPASGSWQRLDRMLRGAEATRRTVVRGMGVEWDGVRLELLGPPPPGRPPPTVRNEDSLVLSVRLGQVTFLLTGDVQGSAEDRLVLPRALVVKVPHHASRSSSRGAFVTRSAPRVAVASLGRRNPFGYPHPEVVGRYREAGAVFLRTDLDGEVSVATDGERLWIRTSREAQERRIR